MTLDSREGDTAVKERQIDSFPQSGLELLIETIAKGVGVISKHIFDVLVYIACSARGRASFNEFHLIKKLDISISSVIITSTRSPSCAYVNTFV